MSDDCNRIIPWSPILFNAFGDPMAASAPGWPLAMPSDVKPNHAGLSLRFLREYDMWAPDKGKGSVVQVKPPERCAPRAEGDEPRISAEAADYLRQWFER